jgi:5'-phosphate synthase pdxT subunit
MTRTVGVLAVQGGFAAHARALEGAGLMARAVRTPDELGRLDGLVLPGGESTAQWRLLGRHGLAGPLRAFVASGAPVLATCAGLILLATEVTEPAQPSFALLDVTVARNAWGRQLDSFEALADDGRTPLLFIRAPRIRRVGRALTVLATLAGEPVLVRQGNVTGATFHPELTSSPEIHRAVFA